MKVPLTVGDVPQLCALALYGKQRTSFEQKGNGDRGQGRVSASQRNLAGSMPRGAGCLHPSYFLSVLPA